MARKKLGRVLERIKKKQLGTKNKPYPDKLKFLKSLPFYAITKLLNPDGEKVVTRIELTVPKAREIAQALKRLEKLEKKCAELEEEKEKYSSAYGRLYSEHFLIKRNYDRILRNIEGEVLPDDEDFIDGLSDDDFIDDSDDVSIPSTMSKIEETATNSKPMQGGSPGLKKR